MQQQSGRTFSRFLTVTILIFGISFGIAYVAASFLLANIGFAIAPIAALLPPPANDPFWVLYILVYALISLFITALRYKTGGKF